MSPNNHDQPGFDGRDTSMRLRESASGPGPAEDLLLGPLQRGAGEVAAVVERLEVHGGDRRSVGDLLLRTGAFRHGGQYLPVLGWPFWAGITR
jgi:hypothetical protein